ncbi:hypothetical protein JCM8202_000573 [Rhodotorula sphaerocarpa]
MPLQAALSVPGRSGGFCARSPAARTLFAVLALSLVAVAQAHDHHEAEDVGPYEHNFTNDEPIDRILQWHIAIQVSVWGILFPVGMVLGIARSRFHVPLQTLGIVLTLAGNYLGHHHRGRSFHMTAHAHFATYLWLYLVLQTVLGVFLKLHVLEGSALRRGAVTAHGFVGKTFPVVGWVQMIFGGIAALGFCFADHFGQCLAHFIMGSAFIGYALILLMMLRVGAGVLARKRVSQEYLDSWVIMLWGIVNTFTEHNFLSSGGGWSHKDMQHVSLGVLWWAGGALGIFLGRNGKRNVVPAVIIGMTGYAMANHGQHLQFSTDVHRLFGWCLMAAALARIIEVCFVLQDGPFASASATSNSDSGSGPGSESRQQRPVARAFQHLPPYLLVLSGLTFLSATEEQMQWVAGSGMDSTTYANILFSGAFVIYLVGNGLVELYLHLGRGGAREDDDAEEDVDEEGGSGRSRRYRSTTTGGAELPAFGFFAKNEEDGSLFLGVTLPYTLAGIGQALRSLVSGGRSDNASMAAAQGRRGGGRGGGAGGRGRDEPREMAQYESLPLTGRDSLSGAAAGNDAGARGGRGEAGSDETVFDLGDEDLGDDDDDGGDAYWHDKGEDNDGEHEGAASRGLRGEQGAGGGRGQHRTAQVV